MKRFKLLWLEERNSFWPLSGRLPKQILNLTGKDVMINETINRVNPLVPYNQTLIVTNQVQKKL